tara:strand:- start:425 stop:1885 length:1461 start_codon:yes stop_codon:yes gene_type:complete
MENATAEADRVKQPALRLSEVIGALSYALDLTEGQPPGHSLRCCYIGMRLAQTLALDDRTASDLYYTLLLKDAGCSSNAARLCELYAADDRKAKHDIKTVDLQSIRQLGKFVLSHTGLKAGLWTRFKLVMNLMRNGKRIAAEVIEARCERGAAIALQLGFNQQVADGIQSLDEHHNGKGNPCGIAGEQIPLLSRIALLSQVVDVFHRTGGEEAATAEIQRRSGTWFDPELVAQMLVTIAAPDFWAGLNAEDMDATVVALEPSAESVAVDDDRLDAIAIGFGQVIDAKSPYTSGHSGRVAEYSTMIAQHLGLDQERQRWIRRAAMLHDIGKLGVSNEVLDKPGKLNDDEWTQMREHPVHTFEILSRIAPFRELAYVAGAHHEKMGGGGYPWGLSQDQIPIETRIITVADIWDAISADRPYRAGMPLQQAIEVMRSLEGDSIDPKCVEALFAMLPDVTDASAKLNSVQALLGNHSATSSQTTVSSPST